MRVFSAKQTQVVDACSPFQSRRYPPEFPANGLFAFTEILGIIESLVGAAVFTFAFLRISNREMKNCASHPSPRVPLPGGPRAHHASLSGRTRVSAPRFAQAIAYTHAYIDCVRTFQDRSIQCMPAGDWRAQNKSRYSVPHHAVNQLKLHGGRESCVAQFRLLTGCAWRPAVRTVFRIIMTLVVYMALVYIPYPPPPPRATRAVPW